MKHKTEFDDRPLPHTAAMKEPENRFNDARRRYEGTMGAAVVSSQRLILIGFLPWCPCENIPASFLCR